jgi:hypothetical protein
MSIVTRCAGLALAGAVAVSAARAADRAAAGGVWSGPQLVSPGGLGHEGSVRSACPSFSWAALPGAVGYDVVVYQVRGRPEGRQPDERAVFRAAVPAGATTWTPDSGTCLEPGRYGWAVGALEGEGEGRRTRWSRPAVFRVEGIVNSEPGGREVRSGAVANGPARVMVPAPSVSRTRPGLRAASGEAYVPAGCRAGGETFTDVPESDPFCRWIEQMARDGIAEACAPGRYCPDNPVTQRQAAAMLERAMRGTATWSPLLGSPVAPPPAGPSLTTVPGGFYPSSIAIGADGLPIVASGGHLNVMHCNDLLCAGGDETTTTVDGNLVDANSIVIGVDGLPIVSYRDFGSGTLTVAHCNDRLCVGFDETITTLDATGNVAHSNSMTIGADGLPIISYNDLTGPNFALKVAHCNDPQCAGGDETMTTVDATASVGAPNSIAIGADGLPIISYYDGTSGDLKVAHCNEPLCVGGDESKTAVDTTGDVGSSSSITIGADGLPIISYYDSTNGDLKVTHCNDVQCAGGDETKTAVDTTGDVGSSTSITIGADGLPIISYYDTTNHDLKVAHCNDVLCAGGDESKTTVDGTGDVGSRTSITIGADGLPIITYLDNTNVTLKVAHCANALCLPFSRRHGDPGAR